MPCNVVVRIVRDDGREFVIDGGDWKLESDGLAGWAELSHEVSTVDNAGYDGATVTSSRVGLSERTVTAVSRQGSDAAAMRAYAVSFFNPKHEFDVHLTYQGRTRWCHGVQSGFSCPTGNVYQRVEITWTLLCPDPFLMSEGDFGKDIAEVVGKYGFPFSSCVQASGGAYGHVFSDGFIASKRQFSPIVEITNDGDVDTWCRAVLVASGEVVNPKLTQGDEYVRIVTTMEEGDEVVIDFTHRPPTVTLNGENAIHLCDRTSSFTGMRMKPGKVELGYGADSGENMLSVSVFYHERYLGI